MSSESYHNLIIGKGSEVKEGKSHWRDVVQVYFEDHDKAQEVAMQILNAVHNQRHAPDDKKSAITVSLTGSLEPEDS